MSIPQPKTADQSAHPRKSVAFGVRLRNDLCLLAIVLIGLAGYLIHAGPSTTQSPLSRRIVRVDLRGEPLDKAIDQLGKLVGVEVAVDRDGFTAADVSLDRRIYLHLRDVKLRAALMALLLENDLVPVEEGQRVRMTGRPPTTQTYDIDPLIDRWLGSPYRSPGLGDNVIPDSSTQAARSSLKTRLAVMIAGNHPDNPGHVAVDVNGRLTVFGTPAMQHTVQEFLRQAQQIDMSVK